MPRVPWYIDQVARHEPSTLRVLSNLALRGQEGVLNENDLAVRPFTTPGAGVQVLPGVWGAKCTHVGGYGESYCDKLGVADIVPVNPTGGTARTDLIIARVENPYVSGAGLWNEPGDPINGPYWHLRAIEGVTANINAVKAWNAQWSAITLARITRPANTGIVDATHITDLRSLVDLSGERIVIIENPPATPPPIAQQVWTESKHCNAIVTLPHTQTAWTDWPPAVSWQLPIPSWAVEADILGTFNPQFNNDTWGELRFNIGGNASPAIMWDENVVPGQMTPGPQQLVIPLGGTYSVPSSQRGKIVTMKMQARMIDPPNHAGALATRDGVYANVQLNFKRYPTV